MIFNIKNITPYIYSFIFMIVIYFLYGRYKNKMTREEDKEDYDMIQRYLLGENGTEKGKSTTHRMAEDMAKIEKPILWIMMDYEYNSRNWQSFGSRSSTELNQPYLYLTVKSIIAHCENDFHICLIDDKSFSKLIPTWSVDMTRVSNPIKNQIRELGMMKLLYRYGGMRVPASFVCMRNLNDMYTSGAAEGWCGDGGIGGVFICETVNRNITSTHRDFYPDMRFMGCRKENGVVKSLIDFIQRSISNDTTAESGFLGEYNRWCDSRVRKNQMRLIDGKMIGVKTMDDKPILIEELLSNDYIDLYTDAYGIYIPADDVLSRNKYEWFARMSQKQVLESRIIIAKYLLLAISPAYIKNPPRAGKIEPMKDNNDWISFWKVPSGAPVWGLKPVDLGDYVPRI